MVELLTLAAEKFDQVVLDSPPLLGLADVLIVGNLAKASCWPWKWAVRRAVTCRAFSNGCVGRGYMYWALS